MRVSVIVCVSGDGGVNLKAHKQVKLKKDLMKHELVKSNTVFLTIFKEWKN